MIKKVLKYQFALSDKMEDNYKIQRIMKKEAVKIYSQVEKDTTALRDIANRMETNLQDLRQKAEEIEDVAGGGEDLWNDASKMANEIGIEVTKVPNVKELKKEIEDSITFINQIQDQIKESRKYIK